MKKWISPETVSAETLETALGYGFKKKDHLVRALCHRSFIHEHPELGLSSNERLEFLGDAVLDLVISHLLMQRFPELSEGALSRHRAELVNETRLADISRELGIGPHLLLGKGEDLTHGREKNSILADTLEAVTGAIYQDSGFDAAFHFIESHFQKQLDRITHHPKMDYKSQLQEQAQSLYHEAPHYQLVAEAGPDHDKCFRVRVTISGISAEGTGKSKKMAEQDAARAGLALLDAESGSS
ncbi:ribonuclease III [Desulfosarcina sp. OttesenSCG-928-A07]|nr:ribonuclease III [Desulfosarcina sp. OttesenSCG-928-A07]